MSASPLSATFSLSAVLPGSVDTIEKAEEYVKNAFKEQGFGLPPGTLDARMDEVLKSKGLVDDSFPELRMLGFCSPSHAKRVVVSQPAAAILLPCTCMIQRVGARYHVGALDPRQQLSIEGTTDEVKAVGAEAFEGIEKAMSSL